MKQTDWSNRKPLFVIGYPKSGNTWLARLIADALTSPLEGGKNPIDMADAGKNQTGHYIIHKMHHSEQSKPACITDHSKILYIVRDFRDILVSGFFHFHRNADESKFILKPSYRIGYFCFRYYFFHEICRMITQWQGTEVDMFKHYAKLNYCLVRYFVLGRKYHNSLYVGNWSEHVNYWTKFPNVYVVKYEDLLADTFSTLKSSFSKIKTNCSDQRLLEAIERQSFKIRKNEFQKKGDHVNTKFMRKGVAGDWKRFLDEKMIQRIKKAHGPTMNRLGYEI